MKSKIEKQKHSPTHKQKICIAGIVALLLVFFILLLLRSCGGSMETHRKLVEGGDYPVNGSLTVDNPDVLEPKYFNLKLNTTPTLVNGQLNLRVENPIKNRNTCRVEITLSCYESMAVSGNYLFLKRGEHAYAVQMLADTKSYRLRPLEDTSKCQETTLVDASRTIYRSQLIKPGQSLENCTITEPLAKGKYYATVQYILYEKDGKTEAGKTNVNIEITVG